MSSRWLEAGLLLGFLLFVVGWLIRFVYQAAIFGAENIFFPLLIGAIVFVVGTVAILFWGAWPRRRAQ